MALTILTGSSQAAGVNYSYRTSGSADWSSVPTASYFYDQIDKITRYKMPNGDVVNAISSSYALVAQDALGIGNAITNNVNDRILTATGGTTINAESTLTFNGQTLTLTNGLFVFTGSNSWIDQSDGGSATTAYSHAQGNAANAFGAYSHAEGSNTQADGAASHAEGSGSKTSTSRLKGGKTSTITAGVFALSGDVTTIFQPGNRLYYNSIQYPDNTSFVVDTAVFGGVNTTITLTNTGITDSGFVVGSLDYPYGSWEGDQSSVSEAGHAEGVLTDAVADWSHTEGYNTQTFARYAHAEGEGSQANGQSSHAEGQLTKTFGAYSHAEGGSTVASGYSAHAEGSSTVASGSYSHAEGESTSAWGYASHAEGVSTITYGEYSHAEGNSSITYGVASHAEGRSAVTGYKAYSNNGSGITAGVFELNTTYGDLTADFSAGAFIILNNATTSTVQKLEIASSTFNATPATEVTLVDTSVDTGGDAGYYVGIYGTNEPTLADVPQGASSHAQGVSTQTYGDYSATSGNTTRALGYYQHVVGQFNEPISDNAAFIIGDGVDGSNLHNLLIAASGSVTVSGSLTITGSATIGAELAGPSENTLTLGAKDSGGEGGQLGFNAPGGTYTSASFMDNYQNRFRILKGTNAGSSTEFASVDLQTGNLTLSYGSIIMPTRPAFRVTGATTGAGADKATPTVLSGSLVTVDYNQGSYYNNANGEFTCPLAGLYHVWYVGRTQNTSLAAVSVLKNNGTVLAYWESNANTGHFGTSAVVSLAANDIVTAKVTAGTITFDTNDNWGIAYIG